MSSEADNDKHLPRHVAIIMDGNGRWARQRKQPRHAGHRAGVTAARGIIETCARLGIGSLTLFAFSSENWRRPGQEVSLLMELFVQSLKRETRKLVENNVRLRVIGNRDGLPGRLVAQIERSEQETAANDGLNLNIAASYGGRWDILQATRRLAERVASGELSPQDIDSDTLAGALCLAGQPDPDLFIRTGGEKRISNFLLWQLAYTELYFTDCLWPDFDNGQFEQALDFYAGRERRFGKTSEQLRAGS